MTQIEKIRAMSAEELAEFLMDVEQEQIVSVEFCDRRFCKVYAATPDGEDCDCSDKECVAAAVAYLESEVEEK